MKTDPADTLVFTPEPKRFTVLVVAAHRRHFWNWIFRVARSQRGECIDRISWGNDHFMFRYIKDDTNMDVYDPKITRVYPLYRNNKYHKPELDDLYSQLCERFKEYKWPL